MTAIIAVALFIGSLIYLNRRTGPYVFFFSVLCFGFALRFTLAYSDLLILSILDDI